MTALDGDLVAGTHRGTVMPRAADDWRVLGTLPVPDDHPVSYTAVLSVEN